MLLQLIFQIHNLVIYNKFQSFSTRVNVSDACSDQTRLDRAHRNTDHVNSHTSAICFTLRPKIHKTTKPEPPHTQMLPSPPSPSPAPPPIQVLSNSSAATIPKLCVGAALADTVALAPVALAPVAPTLTAPAGAIDPFITTPLTSSLRTHSNRLAPGPPGAESRYSRPARAEESWV